MGEFFGLDGPIYKYGNILADIVFLSFLWLVFSIPIVTAGASTTALYYVATRRISNREGYIFKDFWTSFRKEFLRSTAVFITLAVLISMVIYNIGIINNEMEGMFQTIMYSFQVMVLIESILIGVYIFALIARFDMKFVQLFKSAFYMANRHILTTLLSLVLLAGLILVGFYYQLIWLFTAGIYCYTTSYFIMRIFKKYRPEIDPETTSELLEPLQFDFSEKGSKPDNEIKATDKK